MKPVSPLFEFEQNPFGCHPEAAESLLFTFSRQTLVPPSEHWVDRDCHLDKLRPDMKIINFFVGIGPGPGSSAQDGNCTCRHDVMSDGLLKRNGQDSSIQ